MTGLDNRTLSFIALVSALLLAAGLHLAYRTVARDPGLRLWAVGASVSAIGYGLFALRGGIPDLLSIVVANTLLVLGATCLYLGQRRFLGRSREFPWYWFVVVATPAALYHFTFVAPSLSARTVTVSAATAAILVASALVMLRHGDHRDRLVRGFLGWSYLAVALFMGGRAAIMPFMDMPGEEFMAAHHPLYVSVLVLLVALNIILGICLPLLVSNRLQQRLIESEERYRTAFQTSLSAVNINRLSDGLYIEVNQAFLDILGYRREDVIGRTSLELNIWADPADRQRLVEALQHEGKCRDLEARFRRKNGELIWGLMSASVMDFDGVPCILSISSDISERKADEEQIRKLSLAVEQSPESIVITNIDAEIEYVNEAFLRVTGYTRDEVIGQ
ncbi:MAG: PAS domain S-box protein, partial [Gammaproteobacteria bacterium]|nr:PAS domain S-box protein [Gammaproteobacteria bacterium]MBU1645026.1 PAS domain S-box protein [Gammaproteobacteria bacterium]MBU1973263.1 PAS domain S-box protein [Gammaproteobacteria bacterium]